jgi:hypothetical protein
MVVVYLMVFIALNLMAGGSSKRTLWALENI